MTEPLDEKSFLEDVRYRVEKNRSPSRVHEERKRLLAIVDRMEDALLEVERHCPCGARPEAFHTHPHVVSCPVAYGLRSRTIADNYNDAILREGRDV